MKTPFPSFLFVIACIFCLAPAARAGCDLQIVSAGPCLADGTPGIPKVGNTYGLNVVVNVTGTPAAPFRIKWTLANVVYYFDNITLGPGNGYTWIFAWNMDLDDPIPWSVTLDPDGVSGDTNLANNTMSGTFTPTPPTAPVELYSPRVLHGEEDYSLAFQPGSGTIGNLYVVMGCPTTHGAQSILSLTGSPEAATVITQPYGVPVFEFARTNVPAATFQDTNSFTVQLNRFRVNPTLLRTNTWADMAALSTNWTQWLAPDARNESTDPAVSNFVNQALPANYRATMTPYDTARALHCAVMARLVYQSPPFHIDAVGVLADGVADCGGFSALLTSSLRQVGIPARGISGFRQGDSQWHARVEFHLPGTEWLVADPTDGNGNDTNGVYAYDFCDVPNADSFFAVDVGDAHVLPYGTFELLQVANWVWSGGATYLSDNTTATLQPNGVLSLTNAPPGVINFYLSDAPGEGSVILQSSTDLVAWSPVQTNNCYGSNINYSFPQSAGVKKFFRGVIAP